MAFHRLPYMADLNRCILAIGREFRVRTFRSLSNFVTMLSLS